MFEQKYTRKNYISALRRRRAKTRKQQSFIIAIIAIFCSIIACATLAFVLTRTEALKNTFTEAYVACDVLETFDGTMKTDVTIKNTGNVQSFIRAKVVVTWMSNDKTKVTALKPIDDTDYVITYADETNADTNWEKGSDGYWYYKLPVNVGKETEELIESCSLKDGVTEPDGYYLSVEIVASAIQSTPESVVKEQWKSGVDSVVDGVDSNGNTVKMIVVKQGG